MLTFILCLSTLESIAAGVYHGLGIPQVLKSHQILLTNPLTLCRLQTVYSPIPCRYNYRVLCNFGFPITDTSVPAV